MYPGSEQLAEKFMKAMVIELGRELVQKNRDRAAIRRMLRIHAASIQISKQSKPQGHNDDLSNSA